MTHYAYAPWYLSTCLHTARVQVDAIVGKVVDHLDAHGIRNNTVIFMTADNGPWLDESPSPFPALEHALHS